MDWSLALNVTITGLVLVFSMLLLLVFVLLIFGWISVGVQKAAEKRLQKKREEALNAALEEASEVLESTVEELPVATSNDDSGNIIAAISAAVAYIYSGSGKKPIIKSVKKSSARRSAWANAGIADNTRTF